MSDSPDDRVTIFSNGSEFMTWENGNCGRCTKSQGNSGSLTCEIEKALYSALCDDGTVTRAIRDRAGWGPVTIDGKVAYHAAGGCTEFQQVEDERVR